MPKLYINVGEVIAYLKTLDPNIIVSTYDREYDCVDLLHEMPSVVDIEQNPSCFGGYKRQENGPKTVVVF